MGSKNKLKRFKENETFSNVIQPDREDLLGDRFPQKGEWHNFFGNTHPIILELGCGKGEYTVQLAREHPNSNFIGIDIKGARLWRGAKTALEEGLTNVCFLRIQIELLTQAFGPDEVDEIWLTFPDPQTKYKRSKHRLTNPSFLERYAQILQPNGVVHLKTDSAFLHGYTLGLLQGAGHEILYSNHDIYRLEGCPEVVTGIQTFYENQYLQEGKPITYIRFRISS